MLNFPLILSPSLEEDRLSLEVEIQKGQDMLRVFAELYSRTYRDGNEPDAFAKLVCHELLHRLHVRILKGDEEAMGPMWFFEGFAVVGSNQFASKALDLSREERKAIILSKSRGSYVRYGKVLRYLLQFTDLPSLVKRAGKSDFKDYVLSLDRVTYSQQLHRYP
jgi:hypothetical protein